MDIQGNIANDVVENEQKGKKIINNSISNNDGKKTEILEERQRKKTQFQLALNKKYNINNTDNNPIEDKRTIINKSNIDIKDKAKINYKRENINNDNEIKSIKTYNTIWYR